MRDTQIERDQCSARPELGEGPRLIFRSDMRQNERSTQRPDGSVAQPNKGLSLDDVLNLPGEPTTATETKSCCAMLYQMDPVRLLLGDTLHPGGLDLTERLCQLLEIGTDGLLLDVACGPGTGTLAVARTLACRAVGVDLGQESIAEASRKALQGRADRRVSFLCGDAEGLPFRSDSFDAVLCECSTSLFPDKGRGVREMARLLRSGGKLGVSDVTVEPGCLPEELKGNLGRMLCLADALPVQGYRELLSADGLDLVQEEDASPSMLGMLEGIEAKLAIFNLALGPRADETSAGVLPRARSVLQEVKALVGKGLVGYRLFVAEKRDRA